MITTFDNPTFAGFQGFIANVMGIPSAALPPSSPVPQMAYDVAILIVNTALCASGIYALAVYNLAGDNLVNYAPDQPNADYFTQLRKAYNLTGFVPGVVTSTSDEGTSASYLNSEFMKNLTLGNLQNLKTPWGRQYLIFAQDFGTLWGLT